MKTKIMTISILFLCGAATASAISWNACLSQKASWYGTPEALRVAGNLLLYQRNSGGWPKNINMAAVLDDAGKAALLKQKTETDSTIDNNATCRQLQFLARVYAADAKPDLRDSFIRGLDYLLEAQYPNGGWPQFYPDLTNYYHYITFNDNAMVNVLNLLQDIAEEKKPYTFVDTGRKNKARQAVRKGIECILKCQVVHDGQLLAWCAQHDEKTFEPAPARAYEKISLSGDESVGIVQFLMRMDSPDPRVVRAVESAVQWFRQVRLTGIRYQRVGDPNAPQGFDHKVILDPAAPPLWARFYELGTNRPIFCSRDSIIRYDVAEISYERRNNYGWYGAWPQKLLEKDYPEWRKKHNLTQ
jgi:PelA/Pel-15E family pectate lyase